MEISSRFSTPRAAARLFQGKSCVRAGMNGVTIVRRDIRQGAVTGHILHPMKDRVEPKGPIKQTDLHPHIFEAGKEIVNYAVIFVLKDKRVGSGIFVNTSGYDGILTAHHVAKPVLEGESFALCVDERPHGLYVKSDNCEHVSIGHVHNNLHPENGPDLSFIVLRDANLLATLRSKKSFYHLETKDLEYFQSPLERMIWIISGSPHEASKMINDSPSGYLMGVENFVGEAAFHSRTVRDGFDFIQLKLFPGSPNYPKNCEGMSGGGMWLMPLSCDDSGDPKTIRHEAPILAGVSFYQSEDENGERIITGHGYESIYSRARESLKDRNG